MIVERSMNPLYLSNSYLVADRPGGHAVLIDSGGPPEPILGRIESDRLKLTDLLCTHHHIDHIQHNGAFKKRFGCSIAAHASERPYMKELDRELADGDELQVGDLKIRVLHVPGHTVGQLAFVVDEERVFTGDTLFRRTVGGTRAPGHASFEDLQHSIVEVLMRLPRELIVHPGHTDSTTIGEEWDHNPFIRLWRGDGKEDGRRCTALGRPATLLLRAEDYDGGTKCQVRFDEDRQIDIVAGSRVETAG